MLMTDKAILIAFFSRSGNTQVVANQIHESLGGDVFRIVTVDPYPTDYDAVVNVAEREQKNGYRPRLSNQVANMESYGVVFVGYPNWWSTMPMAVFSFLEQYDFSGKKIAPFCTHEGSALGRSVQDIRKLCPQSVILDGLAIRGGNVVAAKKDVRAWLKNILILPIIER
jgi:flavodoxin